MTKFSVGDLVRLKTGDKYDVPVMTVNRVPRGNKEIECVWFHEEGALLRGGFDPAALVFAEANLAVVKTRY